MSSPVRNADCQFAFLPQLRDEISLHCGALECGSLLPLSPSQLAGGPPFVPLAGRRSSRPPWRQGAGHSASELAGRKAAASCRTLKLRRHVGANPCLCSRGSLLPLLPSQLAGGTPFVPLAGRRSSRPPWAGLRYPASTLAGEESGSKLPHSKASPACQEGRLFSMCRGHSGHARTRARCPWHSRRQGCLCYVEKERPARGRAV